MKRKKRRKRLLTVLVLLMAVGAGLLLYWNHLRQKENSGNNSADTAVDVQEAWIGDIQVTTEGNGTIEPASKQTISSEFTLGIAHVEAEDGDIVKKGDLIASVDEDSVAEQITMLQAEINDLDRTIRSLDRNGSSSLSSPISGRVKRIYAEKGDVLTDVAKSFGGIMEISADRKLKVEFSSDRILEAGSEVLVRFADHEEKGTVLPAEPESAVYTVTISDNSGYDVDTSAEIFDEDERKIGEGVLLSNAPYLVDAQYGICDSLNVSVGTWVDTGSTLLYRKDYTYNTEYTDMVRERGKKKEKLLGLYRLQENPEILAAEDGIVSDLRIADMQTVNEKAALYTLISMDTYWLKAQIDELDIAGVAEGQNVSIVFDAFEEEEYPGRVEKVSALGTNTGGVTTYTVTISMEGVDKVKPGMSATAAITLEEKTGVLLVPVDAVQSSDGEIFVTVYSDGEQKKTPVTLGLVNNMTAEITGGLSEGQQVVVETTKSRDLFSTMMQQRGNGRNRDEN